MQSKSQNRLWDKIFSPPGQAAHGNSVRHVSTGGYIVCGSTLTDNHGLDIYVVRTNAFLTHGMVQQV